VRRDLGPADQRSSGFRSPKRMRTCPECGARVFGDAQRLRWHRKSVHRPWLSRFAARQSVLREGS
jgi:hypothetical protein